MRFQTPKKPITVQHLVLLEDYNFLLLIKYFKQYKMLKHRLMERLLYLWLYAVTFKLLNIHNHFKINIQVPFIVYALINLSTQRLRSLWLLSSTESKYEIWRSHQRWKVYCHGTPIENHFKGRPIFRGCDDSWCTEDRCCKWKRREN